MVARRFGLFLQGAVLTGVLFSFTGIVCGDLIDTDLGIQEQKKYDIKPGDEKAITKESFNALLEERNELQRKIQADVNMKTFSYEGKKNKLNSTFCDFYSCIGNENRFDGASKKCKKLVEKFDLTQEVNNMAIFGCFLKTRIKLFAVSSFDFTYDRQLLLSPVGRKIQKKFGFNFEKETKDLEDYISAVKKLICGKDGEIKGRSSLPESFDNDILFMANEVNNLSNKMNDLKKEIEGDLVD